MSNLLQSTEETYKGNAFVETYAGLSFRLETPVFRIEDLAHSLSMLCRFNGHSRHFYSVAEHSLLVAGIMDEFLGGNPLEGLLHDGTEAYLSDVPAPFKQLLPDWQKLDEALELKLRAWASLPLYKTEQCKEADWLALFLEAYELMPDRGAGYMDPHGLRKKALSMRERFSLRLQRWEPAVAELRFLQSFASMSDIPRAPSEEAV